MTSDHDKAALLSALRKPALSQTQLDEIVARSTNLVAKPPTLPQHLSPWRIGKEAIGLLADGMAVWPILGISNCFISFDDLLLRMWT